MGDGESTGGDYAPWNRTERARRLAMRCLYFAQFVQPRSAAAVLAAYGWSGHRRYNQLKRATGLGTTRLSEAIKKLCDAGILAMHPAGGVTEGPLFWQQDAKATYQSGRKVQRDRPIMPTANPSYQPELTPDPGAPRTQPLPIREREDSRSGSDSLPERERLTPDPGLHDHEKNMEPGEEPRPSLFEIERVIRTHAYSNYKPYIRRGLHVRAGGATTDHNRQIQYASHEYNKHIKMFFQDYPDWKPYAGLRWRKGTA